MSRPFPQPIMTVWEQLRVGTFVSRDRSSDLFDPALPIVPRSFWPCICEPACECGAPEHPGEPHARALAAEIAGATPGCTCPGYAGWEDEPVHDGLCDLSEPCRS